MKHNLILSLTLGATALFWTSCQKEKIESTPKLEFEEPSSKNGQVIQDMYIVQLKDNSLPISSFKSGLNYQTSREQVKTEIQQFHKELTKKEVLPKHVYCSAIIGYAAKLTVDEVEELKNDPRVLSVEPDRVVVLGKPSNPGGGGSDPQQSTPWGVSRVNGGTSASSHRAWIIDSGVDLDHPELNVNTTLSATFLGGNSTPDDQNGHGTHVAGIVAAKNNSIGVVGVAPGTEVVSVRVLDRRGSGSISGVIAGVDYVKNSASSGDVANMSLGGGQSSALDAAVLSASSTCKFVLASGNESDDASNHSPARVNGSNIYTVSAMSVGNVWASFSNYGSPVDYIEPGVNIPSLWKNGGYNTISGTSMAAPHLTGILLLGNVSIDGYVNVTPDAPDTDPIGVH